MERVNKKSIISAAIVLLGLALSVYGALNYQNILSRAGGGSDYGNFDVFQIKDGQDIPITCSDNICETQSLDVKLQIRDINQFTSP